METKMINDKLLAAQGGHALMEAHWQWFEISGRSPKWARRAAINPDGIIYVPAAVAGSEMAVFLCAGYDGTAMIVDSNHPYFPTHWLKKEFPKCRETVEKIERRLKETMEHYRV